MRHTSKRKQLRTIFDHNCSTSCSHFYMVLYVSTNQTQNLAVPSVMSLSTSPMGPFDFYKYFTVRANKWWETKSDPSSGVIGIPQILWQKHLYVPENQNLWKKVPIYIIMIDYNKIWTLRPWGDYSELPVPTCWTSKPVVQFIHLATVVTMSCSLLQKLNTKIWIGINSQLHVFYIVTLYCMMHIIQADFCHWPPPPPK